ncbi:MAG: patA 5, partial [Clostridia bacterium]|nr:patA 5 [Clostridia bacterium]
LDYLGVMLGLRGQAIFSTQALYYIIEYKVEFIIAIVASMPIYPILLVKLENMKNKALGIISRYFRYFALVALFGTCIMYLINSTFNPFIYFRF